MTLHLVYVMCTVSCTQRCSSERKCVGEQACGPNTALENDELVDDIIRLSRSLEVAGKENR